MIGSTIALVCLPARRAILAEVNTERDRQDEKWGGIPGTDRRDDHTYAAVLGEEFGEACQAWLERDTEALRKELVQTAAVAVAWIEELDNGGMKTRPPSNQERDPASVPENEGMTDHQHKPVVRKINPLSESSERYLICEVCGLCLDFRPLEHLGVKTDDWELPQSVEHLEEGDVT